MKKMENVKRGELKKEKELKSYVYSYLVLSSIIKSIAILLTGSGASEK